MAWSTKPNMSQAVAMAASCGSRTSCLSIGGQTKSPIPGYDINRIRDCYIWNGSSWSTFTHTIQPGGSSLPALSGWAAVGTVSNVLLWGGLDQGGNKRAWTWKFIGSAWATTTASLLTSSYGHGMIGNSSNALAIFGAFYTHRWNGTSWEAGPFYTYNQPGIPPYPTIYLSEYRCYGACWGGGTGYICGGAINVNVPIPYVSYYNGLSWSTKPDMSYNRYGTLAGAGNSTSGLSWGGVTANAQTSTPSHTEGWNGSTWSNKPDANYGRKYQPGVGISGTSALTWGGEGNTLLGGGNYAYELSCEQYLEGFPFNISGVITENESPVQRNIKSYERNSGELFQETYSSGVDGSYNLGTENDTDEFYVISFGRSALTSWRMSPSMNIANREFAGAVGSNSAALVFGGTSTGIHNKTEKWNGIVWATTSTLQEVKRWGAGVGTVTTALQFGGQTQTGCDDSVRTTEAWNGSTWSLDVNLVENRHFMGGCGDISDALAVAGRQWDSTSMTCISTGITGVERYNGSSWSTTSPLNTARIQHSCNGIASYALCVGGYIGGAGSNNCEKFNGSTWSNTQALPTSQKRRVHAACGTVDRTLIMAGYSDLGTPGPRTSCYYFNGSAWSSTDSVNIARSGHAGLGVEGESFVAGGTAASGATDTCEIWSDSTPLPRFNALVWDRVTAEPVPEKI